MLIQTVVTIIVMPQTLRVDMTSLYNLQMKKLNCNQLRKKRLKAVSGCYNTTRITIRNFINVRSTEVLD